jgi:hypothetical protein
MGIFVPNTGSFGPGFQATALNVLRNLIYSIDRSAIYGLPVIKSPNIARFFKIRK